MWMFNKKQTTSGFSASSTAEEVTQGIDGSGLTAIVTGASSGIGAETARVLALRGVRVFVCVRNLESGRIVRESIIKDNPTADIHVMELDLSSIASVTKFVTEFKALNQPLNLLINNAGIMATPFMLSKDNIELQFATNHIGHFLLTDMLLENMKQTAIKSKKEGRIVNVSSRRHKFPYREGIRFDGINDPSRYQSIGAYAQSKLANVLHANELARRLKEEGVEITANSVHPGFVATNLFRHISLLAGVVSFLGQYVIKNVEQGASTTCYVALHPQVKGLSGQYFADNKIAEASTQTQDSDLAKKLWDFSLNLVNRAS